MKLKLNHLAPYLPYGLNMYHSAFMFRSNWNENEIGVMIGVADNIQNETFDIVMIRERDKYKLQDSRNHFKPILRPLSDLLKEEDFLGIQNLIRVHIGKSKLQKMCADGYGLIDLPFFITDYLFENHFDFFDLIEKGLAIDINTLSE